MKFKISWPIGIVIAITAFVIFILSFVYKATFIPAYDHHLVSDDYYKDELNYQQEIDNQNKGVALKKNVVIRKETLGLLISFPLEFDVQQISGTISFQRPSNSDLDFKRTIELKTLDYLVRDENLVKGRWDVKIEWVVDNNTYLFKDKITY